MSFRGFSSSSGCGLCRWLSACQMWTSWMAWFQRWVSWIICVMISSVCISGLCLCAECHSSWCRCCHRHPLPARSLSLSALTPHLKCHVRHLSLATAVISLMSAACRSCFVYDCAMFCCTSYFDLLQVLRHHLVHLMAAALSMHSQYHNCNSGFDVVACTSAVSAPQRPDFKMTPSCH